MTPESKAQREIDCAAEIIAEKALLRLRNGWPTLAIWSLLKPQNALDAGQNHAHAFAVPKVVTEVRP